MVTDENFSSHDSPCPRYAHSFLCDSIHKCFYMFGGNPGSAVMRLDDFWRMQVVLDKCGSGIHLNSIWCSW